MRSTIVLAFAFVAESLYAHNLSGVIVEDHSGAMIVSAEIQISRSGVPELIADIESDTSGRFAVQDLPDGHYQIEISKANYTGVDLSMDLLPGAPAEAPLAVRLIRCGSVEGRVLDADGQPLAVQMRMGNR